jgi:phage shock protein E
MRRARQARSATFKSLEALKVVFDVLDPLSELLAATLEGWRMPVVIVFGQETSGKSSLLERLAMMPLLPRGEDTCTRLPILLKLRHTKEAQLPVLVVRDSATGTEDVRRTVSLAGGQVDVRHEMERVLAAEQGGLTSVSMTRTIEVHVHSPAVPSIDLVDLPGLRLSAGSDAADMPEKAKALVEGGALLVDVRSPGEHASFHLPGSINVPVGEVSARLGELGDKQKPVVVYCASGVRSASAVGTLRAAGFTDVHDLGGLSRWPG